MLVGTDVAARGIHVEDIDTVVNFDIPNEPETSVHRVGRTGRAGASGTALSLCAADEREQLASIERLTRRKIQELETPIALESAERCLSIVAAPQETVFERYLYTLDNAATLRRLIAFYVRVRLPPKCYHGSPGVS